MKLIFSVFVLASTLFSFAQGGDTLCNQLPLTRVEKVASDNGAIVKTLTRNLPSSLKKGKHSGIFKIIVDCNGVGAEVRFERGDLTSLEQTQLIDWIIPTQWIPAVDKGNQVTSMVFLTVTIEEGKVEVIVQ